MYKHIKKEYLFIFLVLFTALVLFSYFNEDFKYTSLATKGVCTDKGYQCCAQAQGEETNYFSLDYSCPNNQQCWSSCSKNIKQTNLITTSAVWDNIWNPIKNFFIKLFGKEVVGVLRQGGCQLGENPLFTISEGHASKFTSGDNAYNNYICTNNFKIDANG